MFKLSNSQIWFIGLVLEGFLYGFYSGLFAMYLQYRASKKDSDKKQNIVFYAICALYVLCVGVFVTDIALSIYYKPKKQMESVLRIFLIQTTSFGCSDFIAQVILIYRCWIVWGCNIRAIIVPSILAFAFLVTWLAGGSSIHLSSDGFHFVGPKWGYPMYLSGLALSLTVNALVTGLIVFRIFKVFRQVGAISDDRILCGTGGRKLRRTILVLIESGVALFSIQLVRLVVTFVKTETAKTAFYIIIPIHHIFNGIALTIIVVRISMGLSFHDEKSMEEIANGSLSFVFNHPNSVPETTSNFIVAQDSTGDDNIGILPNNDIDILER